MNVVFGIGISILIFIVVLLGIEVFYPRPTVEDFGCDAIKPTFATCDANITVAECREIERLELSSEYQECWDRYTESRDIYNKNFFLVTATIGFIAIIASMYLFSMINIAAGTAFAGLALIVFGFTVGWQSADDILKFIVSLLITVVVVAFAVIVNKRYEKKGKKRKK